jgi:uncharacterized protein with HEPN domain
MAIDERLKEKCAEIFRKIERCAARGKNHLLGDVIVQDAVLRNFEVIGEPANRLEGAYREPHEAIPT